MDKNSQADVETLLKLECLRAMESDKSSKPVRIRSVVFDLLKDHCERQGLCVTQFVTIAVLDALRPETRQYIECCSKEIFEESKKNA